MTVDRRVFVASLAAAPLARAATKELPLAPFTAIEVGGSVPLELVQRQPALVRAEGDEGLLQRLTLKVEDGVLRVKEAPRVMPDRLRIVVQVWVLERLEVSGSARVSAAELVAKRLAIHASGSAGLRVDRLMAEVLAVQAGGSAGLRLAGRANELQASLGGSSVLDAEALRVRRVGVKLGGSSHASVWADDTLDGAVGGSSNLRHRGAAHVQVARGGSAGVTRGD